MLRNTDFFLSRIKLYVEMTLFSKNHFLKSVKIRVAEGICVIRVQF